MDIKLEVSPPDESKPSKETAVLGVVIPELNIRQFLYVPFDQFRLFFGISLGVEADLLIMAATVYLVDQLVPRSYFADNWTREMSLSIPVEDPRLWNRTSQLLAESLQFLTGDKWHFIFSKRHVPIFQYRAQRSTVRHLYAASTVSLFSGGLDSLVGAIDLLEKQNDPVLLVGHYDLGSSAKKAQAFLIRRLEVVYPWRINSIQARVGAALFGYGDLHALDQSDPLQIKEMTFRSRSLLFLALGLYVARQHTKDKNIPLLIPENGFIALNPPLSEGRVGSCSTRTTHPTFLRKFCDVIKHLGIENSIENPFWQKSKGQILSGASNAALVNELASSTISCAHPTRRQGWKRRHVNHCGYCIPCLIRRASLHRVGLDNGADYGVDVLAGELGLTEEIASDFRCMLFWVSNLHNKNQSLSRIASRLDLPYADQAVARHVVQSGYGEIMRMIADKASDAIKSWAGLEDI